MSEDNQAFQRQLLQKRAKGLANLQVDPTSVVNHETRPLAEQSHVGYSGVGDVEFSVAAAVGGGEEGEFTALAIVADAERMCSRCGRSLSR
ncbi:hypothetical protein Vadar_033684 [Vaccinium darrowii]|uniref:Uncharacterized protein n=1 Tax=Vaccinium darrowii TaxID=229202 RepID=A0ACB7ZNI4_9ERIC|nr:hypothetical protein Vadar_033684 [Vaccinium darrowii]